MKIEWKELTEAESAKLTFVEPEPTFRANHPVLSPDGRALWNGDEAWLWILPEMDEESFYFSLDAEGPVPPWYRYMEECEGLTFALFPDALRGDQLAAELLAMGVAPGQAFFIHMTFRYYRGDGWETDDEMEIEWELRAVEPLSPDEVADRWADWLAEWRRDEPEAP